MGGVLKDVNIRDSKVFYRHYLHDFVRLVHRSKHNNKKNEIKEFEVRSTTILWR